MDASSYAGIGQRLKRLRDAQLVTQAELSTRAGVPLATIKDIERGVTRRPRNATIRALAIALVADPLYLLHGVAHIDENRSDEVL